VQSHKTILLRKLVRDTGCFADIGIVGRNTEWASKLCTCMRNAAILEFQNCKILQYFRSQRAVNRAGEEISDPGGVNLYGLIPHFTPERTNKSGIHFPIFRK